MAHARTVLFLGLALLVLSPASVSAQPEDIRTIDCPGAASTMAGGLNDAGRVVGVYFDVLPIALGGIHGFIWEGRGCEPIPGLPDASVPVAQNDVGQVIGVYGVPSPSELRGFLYRRGQLKDLLCPATEPEGCVAWPRGINNRGQIVGYYEREGPDRPFMWEDGSYVALGERIVALDEISADFNTRIGNVAADWLRPANPAIPDLFRRWQTVVPVLHAPPNPIVPGYLRLTRLHRTIPTAGACGTCCGGQRARSNYGMRPSTCWMSAL